MNIEFIPTSKNVEIVVPPPKPAKLYIPDWYKNTKSDKDLKFKEDGSIIDSTNGLKRCMPFIDGLMTGYIQETWCDIHFKNEGQRGLGYSYASNPKIIGSRDNMSIDVGSVYYQVELVWKMHWLPKLPKGWSAIITSPQNRLDLPFRSLTGIIDSDNFYHVDPDGGSYPFFLEYGFEGIIPAGTPMYQIIPFKRENWKSSVAKFDPEESIKNIVKIKKYFLNGYKKVFWQKKTYE
jgi:hypothetical protein